MDLWRHTLSKIPSIIGRLEYLSTLRNSNTGRYEHHGLASVYGERESDKALSECHGMAFREWIGSSLHMQKSDLDLYLETLPTDLPTFIRTWIRLTPYRNFLPESASATEQDLYMADMDALLGVLRAEHGVSLDEEPSAPRRR